MFLDRLDKLRTREKIGLLVAVLVLLGLLIDNLVVKPVLRTMARMDTAIEEAESRLAYNLGVLRWKDDVEAQYAALEGLLLPGGSEAEEADKMTAQIDRLAREAGMQVPAMGSLRPASRGACEEYAVEIKSFEADLPNLLTFLYRCRQAPGLLKVSKLALEPKRDSGLAQGSMVITKVLLRGES
ncbi:MAG: type II secretion system protein M [Lentisphaerae bacterium]|nr:type II secretion system protein M [Lentisphaerota bacterium]